eukprot:860999-Pleurochrysis_carterae.AAC.1
MGENVRAVKCMQCIRVHVNTSKYVHIVGTSASETASACGCWLRLRVYVPMPVVEELGEILTAYLRANVHAHDYAF